jgi:hypothetical protein
MAQVDDEGETNMEVKNWNIDVIEELSMEFD